MTRDVTCPLIRVVILFYILSLINGILISLSVVFNGLLSAQHGIYFAPILIHLAGLIIIAAIVLITRVNPFAKRQKWYLYIGGALGVFTIMANNIAYGRISVSALLALLLFGQSLMGLIVDQYGLMGMKKHPFNKKRIAGLLLTLCGIAVMVVGDRYDFLAVIVSFAAGINIVIARTFNGRLADITSVRTSTFFNYFIGLLASIPLFLVFFALKGSEAGTAAVSFSTDIHIYLGGVVGMILIAITNYTVTKVPAFYFSLLVFIGQVFSGIMLDTLIDGTFSPRLLAGGVLVTLGLCSDLLFERKKA